METSGIIHEIENMEKISTSGKETNIDVLIVGAGTAGLSSAIKLKQLLNDANLDRSVVVIDKSQNPGFHNLSGAVVEIEPLSLIVPDWKERKDPFMEDLNKSMITRDELVYLTRNGKIKVPEKFIPKNMNHKGNYALSASRMSDFLTKEALSLGVEIYNGYSIEKPLIQSNSGIRDNFALRGVKLKDVGLNEHKNPKSNFIKGENLEAKITILADGTNGTVSREVIKQMHLEGKNNQVYSVGIKQIIELPEKNNFKDSNDNRAIHTMGFPFAKGNVFGGGFMYSMPGNVVAIGLILGLDWEYSNLNPEAALEKLKSHSYISHLLKGGRVIETGAKTIPEGGYYAMPKPYANGALLIGDAAGLVNMKKIKGWHLAVLSGVSAAETAFSALKKEDYTEDSLKIYTDLLSEKKIIKEMYSARNYRQSFSIGLYLGAPLSMISSVLPRLKSGKDYESMKKKKIDNFTEGITGEMDKDTFAGLSGTMHSEDSPPHIEIIDTENCVLCFNKYGHAPCESFCPGGVYRKENDKIIVSASNCLHDQSCMLKCPIQNILWTAPVGGEGPRYKNM